MKTFKTHIKERYSGSDKTAASVGTSTANGVEDSNIGVHNIHDADVLKRVNAFVGSVQPDLRAEMNVVQQHFEVESSLQGLCRGICLRRQCAAHDSFGAPAVPIDHGNAVITALDDRKNVVRQAHKDAELRFLSR